MNNTIKRIILLVIMLSLFIIGGVFAKRLDIRDVQIIFPDGAKIRIATSEKNVEKILMKNKIILLDDEEYSANNSNRMTITIRKKAQKRIIKVIKTTNITDDKLLETYKNIVEKIEKEEIKIPYKTITKRTADADDDGATKVIQIGESGIKELTYRVLYSNDKEIKRTLLETKILKEPVDKIVQLSKKILSRSARRITYSSKGWSYSENEIDFLCAITAQEACSSYEASLAVITAACNRAESRRWRYLGSDPLSQYKAKGQFTYSIDGHYKRRLNGNYPNFVKTAVLDALNGKRNHRYTSFRTSGYGNFKGVNIGGNVYFGEI